MPPVKIKNHTLNWFETEAADEWFNNRIRNALTEQGAALETMEVIQVVVSRTLTQVVIQHDEELKALWTGWRRLRDVIGHADFPRIFGKIQHRIQVLRIFCRWRVVSIKVFSVADSTVAPRSLDDVLQPTPE